MRDMIKLDGDIFQYLSLFPHLTFSCVGELEVKYENKEYQHVYNGSLLHESQNMNIVLMEIKICHTVRRCFK